MHNVDKEEYLGITMLNIHNFVDKLAFYKHLFSGKQNG